MKYIETEKIELKRSLNETLKKEVVAFLNTMGGVIEISETDLIINIPYNISVIDSSLIDNETLNITLEGEKNETLGDDETLNETLEDEKSETLGDDETLNETLEGEKSETLGDSETLNETLEGEKSETLGDDETLNETLEDGKSETLGDDVIQKKDIVKIINDMVKKDIGK